MNIKLVNRYLKALFEASTQDNNIQEVYNESLAILKIISENKDFQLLLNSPIIRKEKKLIILKELFQNKVSQLTLNLLILLVKNRRESYTAEILKSFIEKIDESNNIIKPEFTTAFELTDAEKNSLVKNLNDMTNKNSKPVFKTDKELIGGFTIKMKDSIYDASIKRQYELMRTMIKNKN